MGSVTGKASILAKVCMGGSGQFERNSAAAGKFFGFHFGGLFLGQIQLAGNLVSFHLGGMILRDPYLVARSPTRNWLGTFG
jgi:hypothetical protein